jgi:hypothetical protein
VLIHIQATLQVQVGCDVVDGSLPEWTAFANGAKGLYGSVQIIWWMQARVSCNINGML